MGLKFVKDGLMTQVNYAPWDYPAAIRRYVEKFRPDALVLEYTELWPWLINTASEHSVMTFMHNARFSARSFKKYHWLFRLYGNLLQSMRSIYYATIQSETARWSSELFPNTSGNRQH